MLLAGGAALVVESYAALVHSGGAVNDLLPAYLALVVAQLAVLADGFHPAGAVPTGADRAVGARLVAGRHTLGGTIAVPADPGLDLLAGLPVVPSAGPC